ncbi:MAG: hypothetical protein QOE90_3290 [Thermoplasmata archaeon]|jgi:hypothetical protein|nr:hypothetical protein [Thermoplasmata archaeon]
MLGRAWLIVLLMGASALVGCIGGKDDHKEAPASTNTTGTILANQTDQPNGGQISAFKETNATETSGIGASMHAHDYWGGQTRKIIWQTDTGLIPFPLLPDGKPAGTAIADFDIPAGAPGHPQMVFEGTDHLEIVAKDYHVLASQEPTSHPHVTFFFDYLTAGDEPGKFRTGGELKEGQPFILPIKPTDADMPHSEKSLWVFRLFTGEANAITFNITVTAVKGNVVANWPPHPNLYAEKAERVIFDGDVKETSAGTAQGNIDGKDVQWVNPERIISWGTDSVDVTVTNPVFSASGAEATPLGSPSSYLLEIHNATYIPKLGNGAAFGERDVDKATDGKTWRFQPKVDAQSYDSPYGQKSRWGFRFVPQFGSDPTNCLAGTPDVFIDKQDVLMGCQFIPWSMTYHMKIVAHGHSTANGIDDPNAGSPTPPTKA